MRFDPKTETFQSWVIPSGGGGVRHMMPDRNGDIWIAGSGLNKIGVVEVKPAPRAAKLRAGAIDKFALRRRTDAREAAPLSRAAEDMVVEEFGAEPDEFQRDLLRAYANPDINRIAMKAVLEKEAAVVRRIFEACAAGQGLGTIAKTMNEERVPAPRAQQGRPCAWAPTSVREVLYRDLYRGVIVWNQTRKRNAWGLERRSIKASTHWISIEAPHLRIVSDAQWLGAHGRLEQTRQTYLRGTNGHL